MSTYAAFYNLHEGKKAQSIVDSRRASNMSSASSSSSTKPSKDSRRGSLKSFLKGLKPTEEVQKPAGIYTPIIKRGSLFSGLKPAEKAQKPSPIYQRERPLFASF